jgi:hypothetical protein
MGREEREQAKLAAHKEKLDRIAENDRMNGVQMPRGRDLATMTREQHLEVVAAIYDEMIVPFVWIGPIEVRQQWTARAQLHATLATMAPSSPRA